MFLDEQTWKKLASFTKRGQNEKEEGYVSEETGEEEPVPTEHGGEHLLRGVGWLVLPGPRGARCAHGVRRNKMDERAGRLGPDNETGTAPERRRE